jgi:hypothetical protein
MFNNLIDPKPSGRSLSLFTQLSKLARASTFIVKKRKLTAEGFLLCLFKSIFNGRATFQQMASRIGRIDQTSMTKQGLWKRVDHTAIAFLLTTLATALTQRWQQVSKQQPALAELFDRILTEDSTQHRFHQDNADAFEAHGNGRSRTAGVKVDLTIDLLTGQPIHEAIHCATAQDKELGKDLVDLISENDLALRDMGYFILAEFSLIEQKGAYWLSRIPANVLIHTREGEAIENILLKSKANIIDLPVTLGHEAKSARLVAIRAKTEVAEKNLREAGERARKRGHTLTAAQKERCRWHLVATNVAAEKMKAQAAADLYTCRWNIEIIFRAWKQGMNLTRALNRRTNEHHLQALVLAAMIYKVLALGVVGILRAKFERNKGQVSLEKTFGDFGEFIVESPSLEQVEQYQPNWIDIRMDPRKDRKPLIHTWLTLLS